LSAKRAGVLAAALVGLLIAPRAGADDWTQILRTCREARQQSQPPPAGPPPGATSPAPASPSIFDPGMAAGPVTKLDKRYAWEDCGLQIFNAEPVSIAFGSLGPGAGFGAGAKSAWTFNSGRVQSQATARGLVGLNGSYALEARYDAHMPTIGQWNPATATIEDQITISVFARRTDLHGQPFFGLGSTSPAGPAATYRDARNEAGASAYVPLRTWLDAGGGASFLAPTITGIADPQRPAAATSASYVDAQAILRLHTPSFTDQTWNRHDLRLTYDAFEDVDGGVDTFHRVQAFAVGSYELRRDIDSMFGRTAMQNFWCEPIVGRQCRFGTLVVDGLATVASAAAGHVVPFYMQDTLGGTDRNGLDTLRGFDDFRFRGTVRELLQAEFYKGVWGPIGLFGFYDTGKIGARAADLGFTDLRHDYGPGIFLRAGGNIVLRAYAGFGGEGTHVSAKFSSAF
jgi:hypothetical protein